MDVRKNMSRPAAPVQTFARFQAGFLASKNFDCILWFYGISWILISLRIWEHGCFKPGTRVKIRLAALIETIARFQAGFFSSEDFRRIS